MFNITLSATFKQYIASLFSDDTQIKAIELFIMKLPPNELKYSLTDIEVTNLDELEGTHHRIYFSDIDLHVYIQKSHIKYFDNIVIDYREVSDNKIIVFSK